MNEAVPSQAPVEGGEFLTFQLDGTGYGVNVLSVQEIRSYEQPTKIADAPDFLRGVINLRGVIVPIVDLRLWFQCASAELNTFTVVIVLSVRGRIVGIVVDSVSDVVELSASQIRPMPEMDVRIGYASGIGTTEVGEGKVSTPRELILLDMETLLSNDGLRLPKT